MILTINILIARYCSSTYIIFGNQLKNNSKNKNHIFIEKTQERMETLNNY